MKQITDLAGVRIITHFLSTVVEVDQVLAAEFDILEKSNKGTLLIESDRFGYQSIHYLVRIKKDPRVCQSISGLPNMSSRFKYGRSCSMLGQKLSMTSSTN